MAKIRSISTALWFVMCGFSFGSVSAQAKEQFVSLTLCSDRLLAEIARPEQIAAMSPYSRNPSMMLDKPNHTKPVLEPQLSALLPYLDKTLLLNEAFYPQLTADLKRLGVKIIPIDDSPQTTDELLSLIRELGKRTGNEKRAEALAEKLALQRFRVNLALTDTLILSETGVVEIDNQPQYRVLLELLGLTPLKNAPSDASFSLEKVLLSQPNNLISLTDKQAYNARAELLTHPLLQNFFKNRPLVSLPMKYTYCFDHGVWLGAEEIYRQVNKDAR